MREKTPAAPQDTAGPVKRKSTLTKEERTRIAKRAAEGRWGYLRADYEGPLELLDVKIPSAVLSDGTRVLTQKEFLLAMGRQPTPTIGNAYSDKNETGEVKLPVFLSAKNLEPFITNELRKISIPIEYRNKTGEDTWGYDANLLAEVCDLYMAADEAGALRADQQHIAKRCARLMRGFARLGIIALVDEATGYQQARDLKALRDKLNEMLAPELQPYTKLFPATFYQQMFKLRGWTWNQLEPTRGPRQAAYYTTDLVYSRITPGLLAELKRMRPEPGEDDERYLHRALSDVGREELLRHINGVTILMKAVPTPRDRKEVKPAWRSFMRMLDRVCPKQDDRTMQEEMHFDVEHEMADL